MNFQELQEFVQNNSDEAKVSISHSENRWYIHVTAVIDGQELFMTSVDYGKQAVIDKTLFAFKENLK